eukprot:TRINITY_DN818_c0_g1_i1.p4 TRINITY_DN818_c0_g1~~TRINITY_DN818_c0_g1_i1.p4  ORF type:complete len:147 (-),score=2.37 TRINITY_DN818_c0_g1_i1:635-1075(-)
MQADQFMAVPPPTVEPAMRRILPSFVERMPPDSYMFSKEGNSRRVRSLRAKYLPFSITRTLKPSFARTAAATAPPHPEPRITASHSTRKRWFSVSVLTAKPVPRRRLSRSVSSPSSIIPPSNGRVCGVWEVAKSGGAYPIAFQAGF